MDFSAISWLAVVLAALAFFALGGLWYGPLFSKPWMRASGVTEESARESNMALVFGGTLLLELVAAIGLAALIGGGATAASGLWTGVLVALLLVVTALAVQALYERRDPVLLLLSGGYNLLGFAAMGAIIGAFQ